MSDEYKDRYIIIALPKTPRRYYSQYKKHHGGSQRTKTEGTRSDRTKDFPNTYSRSTAETTMNPIGQTFPVIYLHLEGSSEHIHTVLRSSAEWSTWCSVCVFSSHLFGTSSSLDVPAGVTQEDAFIFCAVHAFIFSREKDPAVPFPRRP